MEKFAINTAVNVKRPGSGKGRPRMAIFEKNSGIMIQVRYRNGEVARIPAKWVIGAYTKKYVKKTTAVEAAAA